MVVRSFLDQLRLWLIDRGWWPFRIPMHCGRELVRVDAKHRFVIHHKFGADHRDRYSLVAVKHDRFLVRSDLVKEFRVANAKMEILREDIRQDVQHRVLIPKHLVSRVFNDSGQVTLLVESDGIIQILKPSSEELGEELTALKSA